MCEPCYRAALSRRGDCDRCHTERRLVHPPGPSARLCADCAGVPGLARCRSCGIEERPYHDGNCVRCALQVRTSALIGVLDGQLDTVSAAIGAAPQPYSAHNWLIDHFAIPGSIRREGPVLDDDDARWAVVRRLLHDDDVELTDRVAGCLVLLYGQQLSRIVALTRDQITVADDTLRLHLGATHIEVPEPLASLLTRLARDGRPYIGVGSPAATAWLFPGLDPGRPLTAYRLGQRLRNLGDQRRRRRRVRAR